MKKGVALLLAAILAVSAVPLASAADAGGAAGFAVAADIHYNLPDEALTRLHDDPVFWYANRRCAMENESGFILDAFLAQCAADDAVSQVLIAGDLADDGKRLPAQHEAVAQKLAAFEAASGKPVFVINGNHDASQNPGDTSFDDFKRIYADFGYDRALTTTDYDCSYTADLGGDYRLIALDSCSETKSTEDGMTLKKVSWVLRQAKQAKADGREPVLMMHHNLLDHLPAQRIVSRNFIVRFHRSTAALFADAGIRLVLTGHEHCSDATVFTSPAGNRLYDFATTSLTMYPLAYRVFSLTPEAVSYRSVPVARVDTAALAAAVDGYTDGQLAAMDADLNAYAKGFLKAGVRYRLSLSLSDDKLGISPGDALYPAAHTAAATLLRLLETPYPELRQTAAAYGIELPETAFADPWDLVTELAAAHYEGEEAYPPASDEVRLLLRTAALVLKTDLADVSDATLLAAANRLLGRSGDEGLAAAAQRLCSAAFGGISPAGYLTAALLSPLLYEFANDGDGVPDNDGTVPGRGAGSRAGNLRQAFAAAFSRWVLYLWNFWKILLKR